MPKLPVDIRPQEPVRILKKLDFVETGKRGSHIRLEHPDKRWTQVAAPKEP